MAVSSEFLKLFNDFIAQYQAQGSRGYLSWGQDKNYEALNDALQALKAIIENNSAIFNDQSLLQHLVFSATSHMKTDPIFLDHVGQLFTAYQKISPTKFYSILSKEACIPVKPEETLPSINLLRELHNAMELSQQAQALRIKTLQMEVNQMSTENAALLEENRALKQTIAHQEDLQIQLTQLKIAKKLIAQLALVFDVTKPTTPDFQIEKEPFTPQFFKPNEECSTDTPPPLPPRDLEEEEQGEKECNPHPPASFLQELHATQKKRAEQQQQPTNEKKKNLSF